MATIRNDVTEEITTDVDLFGSIVQLNVIEIEFDREYAPLATIQQGLPIEFTVKGASNLCLDLANSHSHVLSKITKADGIPIDPSTAAPINLMLHSMCREGVERSKHWRHEPALPIPLQLGLCSTSPRRPNKRESYAKAKPRTQAGK